MQNREPLFGGLEERIAKLVLETAALHDVRLLAYAVMPNHLHAVLAQGACGLNVIMQSLLQRVALMVQRRWTRQDHVFGRRYHAVPCLDADYFRTVITYVHLNPVRAGVCKSAEEYAWTSHGRYIAPDASDSRQQLIFEETLRLFAINERQQLWACRRDYLRFIRWRCELDTFQQAGGDSRSVFAPSMPHCAGGDCHWTTQFAAVMGTAVEPTRATLPDLAVVAAAALRDVAPDIELADIRSGLQSRAIVAARRAVIARCLVAGYRTRQVARYLGIASSSVSLVASAIRNQR